MSHWKMGHEDEGRKWYKRAVEWLEKNSRTLTSKNREQLSRFWAEAKELLNVKN
jgi:hypothetical protein